MAVVKAIWDWLVAWISLGGRLQSLQQANERIEEKLQDAKERLAALEARASGLESRITRMEGQIWEVYGTVREHEGRLHGGFPPRYPDPPSQGAGERKQ